MECQSSLDSEKSENCDSQASHGTKNRHKLNRRNITALKKVCPFLVETYPKSDSARGCPYGENCRYSHDINDAIQTKLPDIEGDCPVLKTCGHCRAGLMCRWANSHRPELVSKNLNTDEVKKSVNNNINMTLQSVLRKRNFDFSEADSITYKINNLIGKISKKELKDGTFLGHVTDEDVIKLRQCEKKQVDFKNKLYLTPLTTLGNLPFRRICKGLGADITCGEMALATNLLQGKQSEWALLRRHASEDVFGVQICGGFVDTMTRCAEMINQTCDVDFVDINCGCPIELIYKKGAGSGLLRMDGRLESIVVGMNSVLRAPVTVKMRTGVQKDNSTCHQLLPNLKRAGVSLFTIHGRSREQRYTGLANWNYIKQCVQIADPVPVYGNGDILTYDNYIEQTKLSGVSGVAIARGALIKPWIFKEIREASTWDISSNERLDILRDYVNYGLEYWGSDSKGVETTRRFLLEWLSFLYRYIPYGILERVPQHINERPPLYFGRNDLETLMASPKAADWVKISELFLGPVPQGFQFTPKHKANAY